MVDKKTFWTGVLAIMAVMLLALHAMQPTSLLPTAEARLTIDNRDFAMATAEAPNGGEVLYILDKRNGALALMNWNTQTRRPEPVDVRSLQQVLGAGR